MTRPASLTHASVEELGSHHHPIEERVERGPLMANTDPAAVIERLLDDDYIHEQMAVAGAGMRDAYRRVRRLPPQKAIQDKTVYERVRQAATGLSEATRRALGKPQPKPPRRHRGLLVLIVLGTGAVVVWAAKSYSRTSEGSEPPGAETAQPTPTATATPADTDG
jgi:hypothetical protein